MEIPRTTWDAIVALLSPKYPDLTSEDLQDAIKTAMEEKCEFITLDEARSMLRCSRQTMWRLVTRGKVRVAHPVDGRTLYCLGDIRKLLRA